MKKNLWLMFSALALAVLTSCSSVQTAGPNSFNDLKISPSGDAVAHVSAFANGLYFLCFPIITGSSDNPGSISLFSDTVNVTKMTDALTRKSAELNADTTLDLASSTASTSFVIPPIPYPIFSWKTVYVSGNAVK